MWRLAESLTVLRDEVNACWPDRSKVSDGTIGDTAHQHEQGGSDHNPNAAGVVRAFDITHDPHGGPDGNALAEQLRQIGKAGHPAPWYVVWDRRIASRTYGWAWRNYQGPDPHTSHVHVSCVQDARGYDSPRPWGIEGDDMPLTQADADLMAKTNWDYLIRDPENPGQKARAARLLYLAANQKGLAAAIAAALPPGVVTQEQLEAALREVLGSLDT